MLRPRLLFTIDVEEDMPGWRITNPITTGNVLALPKLAALCEELGVQPTYLCTHPAVTQPESARVLRELARRGGCEIGTHLHPWTTPPYLGIPGRDVDERTVAYYLTALGPDGFRKKLATLHGAVGEIAGKAPTSFRAGRYGLDAATAAVLPEFGYVADTSVTPLVHHDSDGGPDFRSAPQVPYRPSRENLCARGDLPIVEIPVSIALTRRLPEPLRLAYARIPRATRIRGLLSRDFLNILDFAWLYPAKYDVDLMRKAASTLHASGNPVLNVFLHSSELVPGASQLINTPADAEACFARIRGLLEYCVKDLGAAPATLTEAARAA